MHKDQHFHAVSHGEFDPDTIAAATAQKDQCAASARELIAKFPVWALFAADAGVEQGDGIAVSDMRHVIATDGPTEMLAGFYFKIVELAIEQLQEVTGWSRAEAATLVMQNILTDIVLKDIPDDDEPS